MTIDPRPGDTGGVESATERALRDALLRSADRVPDVPDLVGKMHRRAGRLRRRRRAVAASAAVVVAVAVVLGGARLLGVGGLGGAAVVQPAGDGAADTPPPSGPPVPRSPGVTGSPTGPSGPAPSGTKRTAGTGRPTRATPSVATGVPGATGGTGATGASVPGWGAPGLDEDFTSGLDAVGWTPYSGPSGSPETVWSPEAVAVRGGLLRLSVERVSGTTPVARAGGVKRSGSGERYGRWEIRWRMTAGYGVTGQFLFLGEGPGGIGHLATLAPAERRLTVADLVHGTSHELTVDGTRFHTLAVESTPRGVRWLLDGAVVVDEPGAAPARPVVAAVQALIQGADCGRRPLPSDCAGPATFPQVLEVDRARFWAYRDHS